jgi:predicted nucleic acid-binding protein
MAKPMLILDSSPLITLALFPVNKPAIETILNIANIVVEEKVAEEVTISAKHRDALVIKPLLDKGRITTDAAPVMPVDRHLERYSRLDAGERNTIRLALQYPDAKLVIDETFAFVVAHHCELEPIMLLDLLANWTKMALIDRIIALQIVNAVSSRYSEALVEHTKFKLRGEYHV